ncbi:chemotaxis protein CheW [Perlabentimonas gracilis]|uniref:chemotaxis protein CheW n=1 Tax=Perlabentimonas gracilis TaxID=2715279 RepID=UPI00140D2007|nr:chemotaxis protein CheW [Perlabentimonas gracilis]NHB69684.1 purine-binding chemotaxis protein CheW [Perlabentimonas gracilis]
MNLKNNILNSYLSFRLGEEVFAANAGKVINILEMCDITEVPKAPDYMKGIINLRGAVLPVIDLRQKLGMTPYIKTPNTCIIVLDVTIDNETILVGAIVDAVKAVIEFDREKLMETPSIGGKFKTEFILGIANINDEFVMVLDVDEVFTHDEIVEVQRQIPKTTDENPTIMPEV